MIVLYLDPGSQSFLITLLIALLTSGGIYIAQSWSKIKRWFNRKKDKATATADEEEGEPDIIKPAIESVPDEHNPPDKNNNNTPSA
jgi:hypothetical protein